MNSENLEMPSSIECKAIPALHGILDRILEGGGDLGALSKWVKGQFPCDPVAFGSNAMAKNANRYASLKRAQDTLQEVELARGLVEQLHVYLNSQCKFIKEKRDALSLRTGLESLPENILSDILQLATLPKSIKSDSHLEVENEMGFLREAHTLSRVCQRFRSLILGNALIWNILSEAMPDIRLVKFCIASSKQAPLDVLIDRFGMRQSEDNFRRFFESCLEASGRWNSLRVGEFEFRADDIISSKIRFNIGTIARSSASLEVPNLKDLVIHFNGIEIPERLDARFLPFWSWSMPSLVDLELSGCHPPPPNLSFSKSLRSFRFTSGSIPGQHFEMSQLADFLSSCDALKFVGLQLMFEATFSSCSLRRIASVEEIRLIFDACRPDAGIELCNSIHFPNATRMVLAIEDLDEQGSVNDWGDPSHFGELLQDCLSKHPRIMMLDFTFHPYSRMFAMHIFLPITSLLDLKELKLTVRNRHKIKFWRDGSSLPDEPHLPSVRRLEIFASSISRDWPFMREWVGKFFTQLEKQGILDTFEEFDVIQTNGKPNLSEDLENEIFQCIPSETAIRWLE